ncbi:SUMF1/EgtB/PvdO family nonheme iron enzyme [Caballeronia telluris]|uniref:Aerobic sulfatase maturase family protein n=1 Tax=Caballeronia telluris TaxID=326475 RepID=A0A158JU63_9BURK|nr:SUMF1/EgtB/PvdO family nonheme iron enzyme [Caballeronia telluris]SAL72357.1 aerobic sulfatase maturase family protein [Caballeronia telluris]
MNRDPAPRHPLLARLADARRITDSLFDTVKPEYLYERPIAERHRIVFYIGHLEAFDQNLFDQRLFDLPSANPEYDRLFAFGIDPVDGGLPTDQPHEWPSLDEVRAYTKRIRDGIDARLDPAELAKNAVSSAEADPATLLEVAIEHRLMHAETLAYMLHQLPLDHKTGPSPTEEPVPQAAPEPDMVRVPAGTVTLGLDRASGAFGWDNEFGEQRIEVPACAIDRYMVTNGDYLAFVDAGGYANRAYWNDADWAWKESEGIAHPAFWVRDEARGAWTLRTMFDEVALPLDWPVYVSHAEASAYARWAGKALPSEAQWQRAAEGAPLAADGNFDFRRWEPSSVRAHPGNRSVFGVQGQYGNGWEWTSTTFGPLPGFEPFPFYLGYSANFYDDKHFVLKGGSPRTAACMLRPSFRNWFQAHYQYVYAGFRCVERGE